MSPLHDLTFLLLDHEVVRLMRTCRTLYKTEYPHITLEHEFYSATKLQQVGKVGKITPRVARLLWDISQEFEQKEFPFIRGLKC